MTGGAAKDPARLPVTALARVGPARAEALARLGLSTVRDVLLLIPRGLERHGACVPVDRAGEHEGHDVSVRGKLGAPRWLRGARRGVGAELNDGTGKIGLLFFRQGWRFKRLRELAAAGEEVELYGRVIAGQRGPALVSPRFVTDEGRTEPGTILPVYGLTDGIGQTLLRSLVAGACERFAGSLEELVTSSERASLSLPPLDEAARAVHRASSEEAFLAARRRLSLERLLAMQAGLLRSRTEIRRGRARAVVLAEDADRALRDRLPHVPTDAQERAMDEVARDLAVDVPMRRLLQGDVGSGKTLVANHAISLACSTGGQAALLAPTELLARQHFASFARWGDEVGLRVALLTGSSTTRERREALSGLELGGAQLVIGTHALLTDDVEFRRLDLVVIDEQQRFGVEQKETLLEKGRDVHLLLLSATPIPRTLALSMYGDLEVSVLKRKPPGRGRLTTHLVPPAKLADMRRFLGERMAAGERVFWVCPRIDPDDPEVGGDDAEAGASAEQAFAELAAGPLGRFGVELVHGRVAPEVRGERIERFRRGEVGLLVGTTMLEVGIDVPQATVMVIDGAQRLGLAQLHQLRGRVGRGPRPSWCLLLARGQGMDRLRILQETSDGFRIAEEDLRLRGMGDLDGVRQAGTTVEGLEEPVADLELVMLAQRLVREHPELAARYLDEGVAGRRGPALV